MKTTPRNRLLKIALPVAAVAAIGIGTAVSLPAWADEAPEQVKPMDTRLSDNDRMVGGAPVEEDKPWIAALHNGGSFTCSASQIGAEWIITAAHCVENGGEFSVRIGSLARSSGGEERAVDQVEMHPDYNWPDNDIALLHIPAYENTYAPMATEADVELGQESDIYGWGSENEDWSGPLPENLKHSVGTTTTEYCDTANVVCMKGDAGVAGGDSGGPGFVKSPATGEFVLVGVCAIGHKPANTQWGAYTSIPHNAGWINEVSGL